MSAVTESQSRAFMLYYFKSGLLLFWGCWFSLAFTTNVLDFLHVLGYLPGDWLFRSGNYQLLHGVIDIYHTPEYILNLLFTCDITVQGLSAILFVTAAYSYWRRRSWRFINLAFMLSIALWGVFLLMEEVFLAYHFESVHGGLFQFELISLLAMHLLPE